MPEVDKLTDEFRKLADDRNIRVAADEIDDVLTYALFPQIGLKFLENRDNPDAFEPVPG
jgi:oxaloacetate decarboxylase alpha subunit